MILQEVVIIAVLYTQQIWSEVREEITGKLKIVQIVGSFPPMPCGVGDNTYELSKRLADLGHHVDVITSKDADENSPHENIRIHPVMGGWSVFYGGSLLKRILKIEPDIIHLQYPSKGYGKGFAPSLLGMQIKARKLASPYIITLHEFSHAHALRKAAIMPLLNEVSMVLFPSAQERDALRFRFSTLSKKQSRIIPIGPVLPEDYDSLKIQLEDNKENLKRKWDVPADGVIVNYGFLHPHKGFEVLLKAFEKICISGYKCELWHVGAFDSHRKSYDRFINYISNLGALKDKVKFKGFLPIEEAAEIFTIARVGVFPFTDGYSDRRSSMITFGHFDAPMITTASTVGEVNDRIKKHVTLVEPYDVDQLAEKLEEIIANDALYEHAREKAKGYKKLYDWNDLAKRIEQVYIDLLEDRPIGLTYDEHIFTESEIMAEYLHDDEVEAIKKEYEDKHKDADEDEK